MKPRLPDGYFTEEKNGRTVLYEDVEVYRPVARKGDEPVLEMTRRPVASFGKGSDARDVERVARLDAESRKTRKAGGNGRASALWALREVFQSSGREEAAA